MSARDYTKGNKCKTCGVPVSNRASFCILHLGHARPNYKGGRPKERHYLLNKHCPDCGKPVSDKATRCIVCFGKAKKFVVGKFTYSKNKKCTGCGKPVANDSTKCRSCSKTGLPRYDMRAENNPKWRGGWKDYYGPNWEWIRKQAVKRDRYECQMCSVKTSKGLHVHHIKPFMCCVDYKEANQLSNLITLCQRCHVKAEKLSRAMYESYVGESTPAQT